MTWPCQETVIPVKPGALPPAALVSLPRSPRSGLGPDLALDYYLIHAMGSPHPDLCPHISQTSWFSLSHTTAATQWSTLGQAAWHPILKLPPLPEGPSSSHSHLGASCPPSVRQGLWAALHGLQYHYHDLFLPPIPPLIHPPDPQHLLSAGSGMVVGRVSWMDMPPGLKASHHCEAYRPLQHRMYRTGDKKCDQMAAGGALC